MNVSLFEIVLGYIEQGGFVMPPLVVGTLILWYALGYRLLSLRRGAVRSVRVLVRRYETGKLKKPRGMIDSAVIRGAELVKRHPKDARRVLDDAFGDYERDLKSGEVLIASIVSAAPLAGLLGTVTGMIETFDSLGDMALFTQGGGIAGGISQALFTTQMGLAVAVPGLVIGRLLDRRAEHLAGELDKLKDLLCQRAREGLAPTSENAV